MDSLIDAWNLVCQECKQDILSGRLSEPGYNTWIKGLQPISFQHNQVTLGINSEFKRNIVMENYAELLADCFQRVLGFPVTIQVQVQEEIATGPVIELQPNVEETKTFFQTDSEYTFDNFVEGSSNKFAKAAAMAVANKPAQAYNPLFIYGNSGVGKTHLLLAIHNHIKQKFPELRQVYVRTEDFTNELIVALHSGGDAMQKFHNRYRDIDVLMMDDIQFIAGKESTQEEFFNTFNTLLQNNKQIVLTADRPPKDIKTLDERIRYRFESALLADVIPPDFETRVGIIARKAQLAGLHLTEDILYEIANQVKSNVRQLEGVVKKLQALQNLSNGEIDLTMTRNVIRDIKSTERPNPLTVEKIITEVSRTYAISEQNILSKKKDAPIVFARQIAIYIIKNMLEMTNQDIGKVFHLDHSTITHSLKKINAILTDNSHEREIIEDMIKNLQDI